MALEKVINEVSQIDVLEDRRLGIQSTTRIFDDGVEVSKTYHRRVLDTDADLTNEHPDIVAAANLYWTDDIKAERQAIRDAEVIRETEGD